jgi:hypothetical protein
MTESNYRLAIFITEILPDGTEHEISVPEGAVHLDHIIQRNDFVTEDEWEEVFFQLSRKIYSRIRGNGWPEYPRAGGVT